MLDLINKYDMMNMIWWFSKVRIEVKNQEKSKLENDVEYEKVDRKIGKLEIDDPNAELNDDLIDARMRRVYDPVNKV